LISGPELQKNWRPLPIWDNAMPLDAAHALASTKRFVIERQLGEGGMGVVYQALDLERNARVALKALTQRDALNIYRLKNEFRQLADLSHPNLVTLHELWNDGGSWFFTMELVDGKSFDQYVGDGRQSSDATARSQPQTIPGRLLREVSITLSQRAIGSEFPLPRVPANLKRLRHALRQLVEAVAALHDAGKLHRDIKPSNVLVTAAGRVVVLDFGLVSNSTVVEIDAQDAERTVGGCVFGTPAYMSPEQANGAAITMASDWYAVGTMLYEALTGQLPFDGSVIDILRQKAECEAPPPSEVVKGVPDDLDQLCRELLRRNPSQRPSGAEILRYLTGNSNPPPVFDAQSSATSAVFRLQGELFVGREQHLTELRGAFETSRTGKPVTVFVHGLSGMGKSALVRCFANELIRQDEAVVLRGRCYERETVPYKAFDNIIDALSRYMMRLPAEQATELLPRNVHSLAMLFPVLRRVKAIANARRPQLQTTDARELRNQAFAALKDLLLRISDFHPLVLNIDDLQWADMDSARLLAFLLGPPEPPPLLLIGTYRRDEAANSAFLQHILGENSLREGTAEVRDLAVDSLQDDQAQQLAAALLRGVPGASTLLAQTIAAEADGVPFFIVELVHHLKARNENAGLDYAAQPISLEQVILERVAGMPAEAQRLLRVLSIAAGPLEQGVAIEAAGLPSGDRSALLTLRAARLIRTRGTRKSDQAETYHDRVRETVMRGLPADTVREVHARIAAAMERQDVTDPERLVVHYSGAGNGMRAGETAVQAAHAAAEKLAFNRAAELFRKAVALVSPEDANLRELHKHLGDALANAGRGAQAAEAYLQAAEGLEGAEAHVLRVQAARQYLRSGRVALGTELAREVTASVGVRMPTTRLGAISKVLWTRSMLKVTRPGLRPSHRAKIGSAARARLDTLQAVFRELALVNPLAGAALQAQYLDCALSSGEPADVLSALSWEAYDVALSKGTRAERKIDDILAIVDDVAALLGTPHAIATAKLSRLSAHVCLGRFDQVDSLAAEAEELFSRCPGSSWELGLVHAFRYGNVEQTGDFVRILQDAPRLERDARERDDRFAFGSLALLVPLYHLIVDDPATAQRRVAEQAARLDPDFGVFHLLLMSRTVDCLMYSGCGLQSFDAVSGLWSGYQSSILSRAFLFDSMAQFLRGRAALAAHVERPSPQLAKDAEDAADRLARMNDTSALCLARLLRASLAHQRGNDRDAVSLLALCVRAAPEHHMPAFALYARRALAVLEEDSKPGTGVAEADQRLSSLGIRNPACWVRMFIPGFESR
jgi:serine/threonine protein kinase/tetratricopeptide (TPR) repeat protein